MRRSSRPGPSRLAQAGRDGLAPAADAARFEHFEQAHGDHGIGHLVRTAQRQRHRTVAAPWRVEAQRGVASALEGIDDDILRGQHQPRLLRPAHLGDHCGGLRFGDAADDDGVGHHHAGLFSGDARQRVAEVRHVVEGDRGDCGVGGPHDVGRVVAAAEPDLDDRHLHAGGSEEDEGGRGREFEVGGRRRERAAREQGVFGVEHGLQRRIQCRIGDIDLVDRIPLAQVHEMR